jgi:hypothetical protein
MAVVVDDGALLAVLARQASEDPQSAAAAGDVFTTGSWYWRLSRALRDPASTGALNRAFRQLSVAQQARVAAALDELPSGIGLLSLRLLVPIMTSLDVGRPLNLLTSEAVAAALVLDATITVTTTSELMSQSCDRLGIDLRMLTV